MPPVNEFQFGYEELEKGFTLAIKDGTDMLEKELNKLVKKSKDKIFNPLKVVEIENDQEAKKKKDKKKKKNEEDNKKEEVKEEEKKKTDKKNEEENKEVKNTSNKISTKLESKGQVSSYDPNKK